MNGEKKPYPLKIKKDGKVLEIKNDAGLLTLLFGRLKELNDSPMMVKEKKKAEFKHAVNDILKENGLGGRQLLDRRTSQLIRLYKARSLTEIANLDFYIFFETVSILVDTEPKMF